MLLPDRSCYDVVEDISHASRIRAQMVEEAP
jgi:hypothetical protein